jgi:hypothetical protein
VQNVTNACLLIEVDTVGLEDIKGLIAKMLQDIGIKATLLPQDPHISVGYTIGNMSLEFLKSVASEIAEKSFDLRAAEIELLRGHTSTRDYVALSIAPSADLEYIVGLVSETAITRTFEDGFKTHLSLFSIDKTEATELELDTLARVLELRSLGLVSGTKIGIKSVSIFSDARERVARIPFVGP